MSFVPYGLARPFLFGLDPETAHDLTLASLARAQGTPLQLAYSNSFVPDPVELAGLRFPNRVGLAAGLDKNARCIDGLGAMGFGFVEVGTVTPRPQPGNPKPRMFRLPQANALINRLGFNNEGLDAFVANVQRAGFRRKGRLLGLNIGKNAITPIEEATGDYLACLEGVYPHADYVTVNISSPNTKNLRALQSDEALDALLSAVAEKRASNWRQQHGHRVPLFVKIAPDLDEAQVQVIAATLRRHGMDGVIATNTTIVRDAVKGLPHAEEAGGLSGAPVLEASNRVIAQLRAALGRAIRSSAWAGILSADDALAKLQAGADVVQIYTGLIYKGPALVRLRDPQGGGCGRLVGRRCVGRGARGLRLAPALHRRNAFALTVHAGQQFFARGRPCGTRFVFVLFRVFAKAETVLHPGPVAFELVACRDEAAGRIAQRRQQADGCHQPERDPHASHRPGGRDAVRRVPEMHHHRHRQQRHGNGGQPQNGDHEHEHQLQALLLVFPGHAQQLHPVFGRQGAFGGGNAQSTNPGVEPEQ
jgi:dihydroorotate dehydrogenase